MSDRNLKIDMTVNELRIVHEALTTYWINKCTAAAQGPEAGRNLFNALVRNDNGEAINNLQDKLNTLAKAHTEQARTADLVRMRIEPILEEWAATSRQVQQGQEVGCGGGGGL